MSQNVCDGSCQFGDWNLFPCEHLHTSGPGCHMDIKGKPTLSRRRLLKVLKLLNSYYCLTGVLQTKYPQFLFLSLFTRKFQEGVLTPASCRTGKKLLLLLTYLLSHIQPMILISISWAGEGNDATEPGGPHASQHKNSHSCMKDSMGVSRYLVIRNTQHKTATSTVWEFGTCATLLQLRHQKSLWSQRGCQKSRVFTQKMHGHTWSQRLIHCVHEPNAEQTSEEPFDKYLL